MILSRIISKTEAKQPCGNIIRSISYSDSVGNGLSCATHDLQGYTNDMSFAKITGANTPM